MTFRSGLSSGRLGRKLFLLSQRMSKIDKASYSGRGDGEWGMGRGGRMAARDLQTLSLMPTITLKGGDYQLQRRKERQ